MWNKPALSMCFVLQVVCADLLQMPKGQRSLEGLRLNTRVGVQYLAAWMTGTGSVPLYNLMEDAATAEISRVQNWQWIKYNAVLDGGLVSGKFVTLHPEFLRDRQHENLCISHFLLETFEWRSTVNFKCFSESVVCICNYKTCSQ